MTRSTNARLAGSAYLSYIVVGLLNEALMYRAAGVNGSAAKLARMADYSTDVRLAIILKLGECFSVFVLAVALYGITRDEDQELAMLALLCRVAEGVFIATLIPNSQGLLWLASIRTGVSASDLAITNALGAFVMAPGAPVGAIFFAVGSTIFSYLLLRGRMIPAWLACSRQPCSSSACPSRLLASSQVRWPDIKRCRRSGCRRSYLHRCSHCGCSSKASPPPRAGRRDDHRYR
jgi:hypothetical protein